MRLLRLHQRHRSKASCGTHQAAQEHWNCPWTPRPKGENRCWSKLSWNILAKRWEQVLVETVLECLDQKVRMGVDWSCPWTPQPKSENRCGVQLSSKTLTRRWEQMLIETVLKHRDQKVRTGVHRNCSLTPWSKDENRCWSKLSLNVSTKRWEQVVGLSLCSSFWTQHESSKVTYYLS